jgi:hypothetical protein
MRSPACIAALAVALPLVSTDASPPTAPCEGTFDATFIQLSREQLGYDAERWTRDLRILQALGIGLVIVQFTGDRSGSYERGTQRPVAALLAAAETARIEVYLGLHHDPRWPALRALGRVAPPLDDPPVARALGQLCTSSSACAGWYISREIDDDAWGRPARTRALRGHLSRTAAALRELAPGRPVTLAPFFTGKLPPDAYARWWLELLEPGVIDVVMLQDGIGTGRATAASAREYYVELRSALRSIDVELWAVTELFQQVHGVPVDTRPFAAVPMQPAMLRHSLAIEQPLVARSVAFAVLDYMDPRRGGAARRLHDDYAARCRATRGWRTSC